MCIGQVIELPELTLRKWVPAHRRKRTLRPRRLRVPAAEVTQPLYEFAKLKKVLTNSTFGNILQCTLYLMPLLALLRIFVPNV